MSKITDIGDEFSRIIRACEVMLDPRADEDKSLILKDVAASAKTGLHHLGQLRKELQEIRDIAAMNVKGGAE